MRPVHLILIIVAARPAPTAHAETDRTEATRLYLEILARRSVHHQPEPLDEHLSAEGMSPHALREDLTPGYMIVEGDIQVPIEKWTTGPAPTPQAVFGKVNYWGGTVPFDFAGNLFDDPQDPARRQAALSAMNAISAQAGVVFRPRDGDPDWIRFQQSGFNNSPVGRRGGMQIINIVSWGAQIVIVHEIYHSLGFWHEQSAPDRDDFVTINDGNVCGSSSVPGDPCNANVCQGCMNSAGNFVSCVFNFDIEKGTGVWGPYDFDSFMHYGRRDFSCNGQDTITVKDEWNAQWQGVIGQRMYFSLIDKLSCRGIYPFAGDRWLRTGSGGNESGTFFNPFRGTFTEALDSTPEGGTLLIDPGIYSGAGVHKEAKTLRATYGPVRIGR